MKTKKDQLIEMWKTGLMTSEGKDKLIDILLNPDRKDLDKDIEEAMKFTNHDIERNKRAQARKRDDVKAPHEYKN